MPKMSASLFSTSKRRYRALQQQLAFVRAAPQRRVTPEVERFMAEASERSRRASSAEFLNGFSLIERCLTRMIPVELHLAGAAASFVRLRTPFYVSAPVVLGIRMTVQG